LTRSQQISALLLGLLIIANVWQPIADHPGTDNLYVSQADAFLQGRLDIAEYGWDASVVGEKFYVAFPPVPALLITPVVAILGTVATDTTVIALLLFALTLAVVWRILGQLQIPATQRFWSLLAFGMGTPLWHAVRASNGVWFFAHIVAVFFLILSIHEALGKGRGWLTGVFLAGAMLSRQFTLFAGMFLVVALWQNEAPGKRGRSRWLNLAGFLLPLALAGGGYLWLNYARFGNPLDTGYGAMRLGGFLADRVTAHGPLSPAYFFFNLAYLLFQGFHINFAAPDLLSGLEMDPYGTSLLAASPFVVAAFFAVRDRRVWAAWVSVLLMAFATLFYYNNGWMQVNGQRFTLDFWPLLLMPLALGLQRQFAAGQSRLWQGVILYAVLLNVLALVLLEPLNPFLP
jgi:hypothetical protein